MIHIKLLDGEIVETERYTYEQAVKLHPEGQDLEVGGPHDIEWDDDEGVHHAPRRTISAAAIASIKELP